MIEARVISPRGSLYIAADATRYDLQLLREHVHALETGDARELCLWMRIGPKTRPCIADLVVALAQKLASEGIGVSLDDVRIVPGTTVRTREPKTQRDDVMLVEADPGSRDSRRC